MIHPIIDEYYNYNPAYERSSGFAVSKGLVSNAPGAAGEVGEKGVKEVEGVMGGKEGEGEGGDVVREKLRVVTKGVGEVELEGSEEESE